MPARKSLIKPRAQAFQAQGGRCYYCHLPMWQANPEQFAAQHGLTMKQIARLQCTGEHPSLSNTERTRPFAAALPSSDPSARSSR